MPIIRVSAPPLKLNQTLSSSLKKLSTEITKLTTIDETHITILWHTYEASEFISGGTPFDMSIQATHKFLVDCLIPDFHGNEMREKILMACHTSLQNVFNTNPEQVFAHIRLAKSGCVFDEGTVITW